jgi:hypothetical protein
LVDRNLEVSIVTNDFPIKQHIFTTCAGANIVNYHVAISHVGPRIYDDANMLDPTAQLPRDYVARQIVSAIIGDRESLTLSIKVDH